MPASEDDQLSYASYWDARYQQSDGSAPTHEWFRSFSDLEPYFERNLLTAPGCTPADNPFILHLGSGDSVNAPTTPPESKLKPSLTGVQVVPVELASRGYARQLCVDFSPAVVALMRDRHAATPGIEWRLLDVRAMDGLADASVDVAFDKGTLDAMIHGSPWSPPQEVRDNTGAYLREVRPPSLFAALGSATAKCRVASPSAQGQRPVPVRHVSAAAFHEASVESGWLVGRGDASH